MFIYITGLSSGYQAEQLARMFFHGAKHPRLYIFLKRPLFHKEGSSPRVPRVRYIYFIRKEAVCPPFSRKL